MIAFVQHAVEPTAAGERTGRKDTASLGEGGASDRAGRGLVHSGARSVTLVLRNVEDLENGVPASR